MSAAQTRDDLRVLEALQALEGTEAEGQRLDHGPPHPFPARMPVSVAEYLIREITLPGATVLDPMVGSGTTVVAAGRLGRHGIGLDRDPLAVLVARVASHRMSDDRIYHLESRVLERAREVYEELRLPEVRSTLPREDQDFVRFWFPWRSQKELFALAQAIDSESCCPERHLAWLVFSSLIIAKSAGASHALDITRSRPHKRPEKPIVFPFDGWNRRFSTVARRLAFRDAAPSDGIQVLTGDARCLPLQDGSVDMVLTSPPYLNAIDYLRAHKFSLIWMGYRLSQLRELRGTMVGTERGLWSRDGLPDALEDRLTVAASVPRRRAILRRYLSDLKHVLRETARVLREDGVAVFVFGPTMIHRDEPDAVDVVRVLARDVGLRVVGDSRRRLKASRRSLPPPSITKDSSLSKRMREEVLVAMRK